MYNIYRKIGLLLLVVGLVCSMPLVAAKPISISHDTLSTPRVYRGFSGGMLLHTGYMYGTNPHAPSTPNGAVWGLGGALRVHLWDHLRVGGEGFVSNMPVALTNAASVLEKGSYVRNGFGGVLVESCWELDKVWPYIGLTIGGGAQRSLYIVEGSQEDWQSESDAVFNKQSYMMLNPHVGAELVLTSHVHVILRADYMLPIYREGLLAPHGPRIYIGFMFCR